MTVQARTISDNFRSLIGDEHEVKAAAFTTYNFEPYFFEEEVVPLMLDQRMPYSPVNLIKRLQVRDALNKVDLPVEVFYDRELMRQQGDVAPSMEYRHHGVSGGSGVFHAKLVFILLKNTQTSEESLLVGAGSANLTQAGWWENIECQHWERVDSGGVHAAFKTKLLGDIDWLIERRNASAGESVLALDLVREFLLDSVGSESASAVGYYGIRDSEQNNNDYPAVINTISELLDENPSGKKRWSLDIISPYFAEDENFHGHEFFIEKFGVDKVRLFLPFNDQEEALCTEAYYQNISDSNVIEWAWWSDKVTKGLGLSGNQLRRSHAKVYHLYNREQSWVFVGSVNFTYKAMFENREAGFCTSFDCRESLLTPLTQDPDHFCDPEQLQQEETNADAQGLPELTLCFDWKRSILSIASASHEGVFVDILTPEQDVLASNIDLTANQVQNITCDISRIKALLQKGGFLKLRGRRVESDDAFPDHWVLVQQIHWTHKPFELPDLSPQEILQLYARLNFDGHNQLIERLMERKLRELNLLGEYTPVTEIEAQNQQFFSEYAEIFQAFRNIRRRMSQALDAKHWNQVDYYLTGQGMDSLPTLLERLMDKDSDIEPATLYLTLLSLLQIYREPQYNERLNGCHNYPALIKQQLDDLEQGDKLSLIDGPPGRRKSFFQWYRSEFLKIYHQQEQGRDHASD